MAKVETFSHSWVKSLPVNVPIVADNSLNSPVANLINRLLFPTPLSPTKSICIQQTTIQGIFGCSFILTLSRIIVLSVPS